MATKKDDTNIEFLIAELKDVDSASHEGYLNVGNGKIYYLSFNNKSTNDPIIILHGGAGKLDHSYLLPQLSNLARDNTITLYDQRGAGKSTGFALDGTQINMQEFLNDLESLRKKLGYKKIVLLGHSWGGLVAMHYAINYAENISKLILVDAMPADAIGCEVFSANFSNKQQLIQSELKQIKDTDGFKQGSTDSIRDFYRKSYAIYFNNLNNVDKLNIDISKNSYENGLIVRQILGETCLKNYDLKLELKKLKIPSLIVHGAQDLIPVCMAQQINELLAGSKLTIIDNCGHFPYIEAPDEFFKIIEQFLKSPVDTQR